MTYIHVHVHVKYMYLPKNPPEAISERLKNFHETAPRPSIGLVHGAHVYSNGGSPPLLYKTTLWFPLTFSKCNPDVINPRRACAGRVTAVVWCVCVSVILIPANRAIRRPTKGSSGLS